MNRWGLPTKKGGEVSKEWTVQSRNLTTLLDLEVNAGKGVASEWCCWGSSWSRWKWCVKDDEEKATSRSLKGSEIGGLSARADGTLDAVAAQAAEGTPQGT